jgi:hypothetical protein
MVGSTLSIKAFAPLPAALKLLHYEYGFPLRNC